MQLGYPTLVIQTDATLATADALATELLKPRQQKSSGLGEAKLLIALSRVVTAIASLLYNYKVTVISIIN